MGRVTLQTIADQVGVSRMTVSNAFSRPDQLSESLRVTILDTARELGYVGPDPAARALARGTTGAVGVLLTSSLRYAFDDDVATGFLAAVAGEVGPTGLAITLLTSSGFDGGVGGVVPARDVALDGAIVYSCDPDTSAIDWLTRRGLPLVYADQEPTEAVSCVNVDDRGGARAAARHVVRLGHRRVAVMTATAGGRAGSWRTRAPRRRAPSSSPVSDCWATSRSSRRPGSCPSCTTSSRRGRRRRTSRRSKCSGVRRDPRPWSASPTSSPTGWCGLPTQLGLQVPADLSVVGFDDSPLARRLRPQLTTVHQDVSEKGRLAATALRVAMEHDRAGTPHLAEQVVLPTELVVRHSTAPPPPR